MKTWIQTEVCTDDQSIRIQPSDSFDGITLSFKDSNESNYEKWLYLDREQLSDLIKVMWQIMDHAETIRK